MNMWCMVPRYYDLHGWTRTYQGCAQAGFQAACHLRRLRSFTLYWRVVIGEREREEAVRVWLSGGEREGETDLLGSIVKEWMAVSEHSGETFSHRICLIVLPSCVLFIFYSNMPCQCPRGIVKNRLNRYGNTFSRAQGEVYIRLSGVFKIRRSPLKYNS